MNKSMIKPLIFSSCLLVLLQGCTSFSGQSAPQQPARTLEQTPSCCASLSELSYKRLPINFRAHLILDQEDPVVNLDTGKSYVEALALPQSAQPILFEVESLVQFRGNQVKPEVFFPVVTLLDEHFRPMGSLHDLPFEYKKPVFKSNRIRIVATLEGKLRGARYALIHTTEERLGQGISSQYPHAIIKRKRFDSMIYTNPVSPRGQIRFSDKGKLNVLAYSS